MRHIVWKDTCWKERSETLHSTAPDAITVEKWDGSTQLLLQRLLTEATFSRSSRTSEGLSEHQSAQDTGAGPQAFPSSAGGASLCSTSETAVRVLWPRPDRHGSSVKFFTVLFLRGYFFIIRPVFKVTPQSDSHLLPSSRSPQAPCVWFRSLDITASKTSLGLKCCCLFSPNNWSTVTS